MTTYAFQGISIQRSPNGTITEAQSTVLSLAFSDENGRLVPRPTGGIAGDGLLAATLTGPSSEYDHVSGAAITLQDFMTSGNLGGTTAHPVVDFPDWLSNVTDNVPRTGVFGTGGRYYEFNEKTTMLDVLGGQTKSISQSELPGVSQTSLSTITGNSVHFEIPSSVVTNTPLQSMLMQFNKTGINDMLRDTQAALKEFNWTDPNGDARQSVTLTLTDTSSGTTHMFGLVGDQLPSFTAPVTAARTLGPIATTLDPAATGSSIALDQINDWINQVSIREREEFNSTPFEMSFANSEIGKSHNDMLIGTSSNDRIYAKNGYDIVFGDAGNDKIFGGKGKDGLHGGTGNDLLKGGNDRDVLVGGVGNDRLHGQKGGDYLAGGDGLDKLFGGDGNDVLTGGGFKDYLYGGKGRDILYGDIGNDILTGGRGADVFVFNAANRGAQDIIKDFEAGSDRIHIVNAEMDIAVTREKLGADITKVSFGSHVIILRNTDLSSYDDADIFDFTYATGINVLDNGLV